MASKNDDSVLSEEDLLVEQGLTAKEVDRRLVTLAQAHRRVESALCFYLQEVDERELYRGYGHASTVDYARERLGFDDRKTWSLLQLARREDAFGHRSFRPHVRGSPLHIRRHTSLRSRR